MIDGVERLHLVFSGCRRPTAMVIKCGYCGESLVRLTSSDFPASVWTCS